MTDSCPKHVLDAIASAQVFCFDVDSTLVKTEGIDELADFLGKGRKVKEMTAAAMGGSMSFTDALKMRLDILKPSEQDFARFLKERPFELCDGAQELIDELHRKGRRVHLVTGGLFPQV
mmetsp:Transcript_71314/g.190414  ORF Transcript_71314/g.190414 Transcript_71314/m.190414 type:complete len:119 (-) Transcript_71314:548-904(-)